MGRRRVDEKVVCQRDHDEKESPFCNIARVRSIDPILEKKIHVHTIISINSSRGFWSY